MRSKSYLFLLLVLGLGLLSGYLYRVTEYNYGLDVQGGLRFTYQMDPEQREKLSPEDRALAHDSLVKTLTSRASGTLGVAEPSVVKKLPDQIVIELPGLTDIAKARDIIGTSARIEFYHAKNVVSPRTNLRPYMPVENEKTGTPGVDFQRRSGSDKIIKFGDPEYERIIDGWTLILSGTDLANAEPQASGAGKYQPLMTFSAEGARKMEAWSRKYAGDQEMIAAVLDGRVLSMAHVEKDTILRDNAVINGDFPTEWVRNLTSLLKSGALPIDLVPLSSEKVDPTIGMNALDQMVVAGLASFALISLFLIVYYAFPGVVALIALALYVLFTLTALKLINATFSLAAIAGFILSVGMAVDANILVFERFKEEMKHGRNLHQAIHLGFNRALPAIVDSNACTILTSLVLLQLGTGPVKGFATTLIIGVVISLFTAVFVTRSLLLFFVDSGIGGNPKYYALGRNWFGERFEETANEKPLQIVNNSKKWFIISVASIAILLPFMLIGGFKPNVEFRGGSEAIFSMEGSNLTGQQISENLEKAGYEGSNVKFGTIAPQQVAVSAPKSDAFAEATTAEAKANIVADFAGLGGTGVLKAEDNADGGVDVTFGSSAGLTAADVERNLAEKGIEGAKATIQQTGSQERIAYVTIPPSEKLSALKGDEAKIAAVAEASGLDVNRNKGYTEIGPAIQAETLRNAVLGVALSSGLIILYLAIRFGIALGGFSAGLRFGFSAILALLHDVLFVLGVTAATGYFLGWEISALFITSMLTVIGFSVHDTIVIFDRIRENLRKPHKDEDFGNLINRSITQSFGRSINTSMTVIATLIILLAFGTATPDLKLFCVTMLAGILSGTYSSIYNASPILYVWDRMVGRKKGEGETIMGTARQHAHQGSVITTQGVSVTPTVPNQQTPSAPQGGRTYGQVRRRANEPTRKGSVELDDEE